MQAKWAENSLEKLKFSCSVGHTKRNRHRKSSRRAPKTRVTDGGAGAGAGGRVHSRGAQTDLEHEWKILALFCRKGD